MSLQVAGIYMLCQYDYGCIFFIPTVISTAVSFSIWYYCTFLVVNKGFNYYRMKMICSGKVKHTQTQAICIEGNLLSHCTVLVIVTWLQSFFLQPFCCPKFSLESGSGTTLSFKYLCFLDITTILCGIHTPIFFIPCGCTIGSLSAWEISTLTFNIFITVSSFISYSVLFFYLNQVRSYFGIAFFPNLI